MPVNGDHQRESYRGLGRRHRDGEEDKDDARGGSWIGSEAPECDEINTGCIEHQLDAQQHEDGVAAGQSRRQADAKQGTRKQQTNSQRIYGVSSGFSGRSVAARMVAPNNATVSNTPTTNSAAACVPMS